MAWGIFMTAFTLVGILALVIASLQDVDVHSSELTDSRPDTSDLKNAA